MIYDLICDLTINEQLNYRVNKSLINYFGNKVSIIKNFKGE